MVRVCFKTHLFIYSSTPQLIYIGILEKRVYGLKNAQMNLEHAKRHMSQRRSDFMKMPALYVIRKSVDPGDTRRIRNERTKRNEGGTKVLMPIQKCT